MKKMDILQSISVSLLIIACGSWWGIHQVLDFPIIIWIIGIFFEIGGYLLWSWYKKKYAKILLILGFVIILLCDILIFLAKAGIDFQNFAYIDNFNMVIVLANTILPLLFSSWLDSWFSLTEEELLSKHSYK